MWYRDAIWRHRSGPILFHGMACFLTAPSHCLNQYRLLISEVLWHSYLSKLTASSRATLLFNEFANYSFKVTVTSPIGHYVKLGLCGYCSVASLINVWLSQPSWWLSAQRWMSFFYALVGIYHQSSNVSRTLSKNCWSLRCSWSIACRRCSNYFFILDLIHGFDGFGKDNCKTRRDTFKCWDLLCLILEIWRYANLQSHID